MNDISLLAPLRQSADPKAIDQIEHLIQHAPDRDLNRINALAFATEHSLDPQKTIAAFLHAAQLGLFEMSWNVLLRAEDAAPAAGRLFPVRAPQHNACQLDLLLARQQERNQLFACASSKALAGARASIQAGERLPSAGRHDETAFPRESFEPGLASPRAYAGDEPCRARHHPGRAARDLRQARSGRRHGLRYLF